MCVALLFMLFVVNLLRGSSKNPSIINMAKCGVFDWTVCTTFIVVNSIVYYLQVKRV